MFQKGMLPQSSVSHSLPFLQCYTTFLQNVANYLPVNYRDIEDSNIQHNAMYIILRLLYHTYLTAFLSLVSSNLWWPTLPDRLSFLLTPALPGDLSWLAPPGDPLISNSSHSIPSDRSPNSYKNKVFAWLFNNSVGRTTKNKVHTKKISCHRIRVNVTIKEMQTQILLGKWFCWTYINSLSYNTWFHIWDRCPIIHIIQEAFTDTESESVTSSCSLSWIPSQGIIWTYYMVYAIMIRTCSIL